MVPGAKVSSLGAIWSPVDSYQGGATRWWWSTVTHGERVDVLSLTTMPRFLEGCQLQQWPCRWCVVGKAGQSARAFGVSWNQLPFLPRSPCKCQNFCRTSSPIVQTRLCFCCRHACSRPASLPTAEPTLEPPATQWGSCHWVKTEVRGVLLSRLRPGTHVVRAYTATGYSWKNRSAVKIEKWVRVF